MSRAPVWKRVSAFVVATVVSAGLFAILLNFTDPRRTIPRWPSIAIVIVMPLVVEVWMSRRRRSQ